MIVSLSARFLWLLVATSIFVAHSDAVACTKHDSTIQALQGQVANPRYFCKYWLSSSKRQNAILPGISVTQLTNACHCVQQHPALVTSASAGGSPSAVPIKNACSPQDGNVLAVKSGFAHPLFFCHFWLKAPQRTQTPLQGIQPAKVSSVCSCAKETPAILTSTAASHTTRPTTTSRHASQRSVKSTRSQATRGVTKSSTRATTATTTVSQPPGQQSTFKQIQYTIPSTVTFSPIVPAGVDRASLTNLTPTKSLSFAYGVNGTLGSTLNATFTYPAVDLDYSKFVSVVSCSKTSLKIEFNSQTAFDFASAQWAKLTHLVYITSAPLCPTNGDIYYFLSNKVDQNSLSFTATGSAKTFANITSASSAAGGVTTFREQFVSTSNETYLCVGQSTAPLPAVSCSPSFDAELDRKLGFFSSNSSNAAAVIAELSPKPSASANSPHRFDATFPFYSPITIPTISFPSIGFTPPTFPSLSSLPGLGSLATSSFNLGVSSNFMSNINFNFGSTGPFSLDLSNINFASGLGNPLNLDITGRNSIGYDNFGTSFNTVPNVNLSASPWGQQIKLYEYIPDQVKDASMIKRFSGLLQVIQPLLLPNTKSSPGLQVFCLNCTMAGNLKMSNWGDTGPRGNAMGDTEGEGPMSWNFTFGINAFASTPIITTIPLATLSFPSTGASGYFSVYPRVSVSIDLNLTTTAPGQIVFGSYISWSDFHFHANANGVTTVQNLGSTPFLSIQSYGGPIGSYQARVNFKVLFDRGGPYTATLSSPVWYDNQTISVSTNGAQSSTCQSGQVWSIGSTVVDVFQDIGQTQWNSTTRQPAYSTCVATQTLSSTSTQTTTTSQQPTTSATTTTTPSTTTSAVTTTKSTTTTTTSVTTTTNTTATSSAPASSSTTTAFSSSTTASSSSTTASASSTRASTSSTIASSSSTTASTAYITTTASSTTTTSSSATTTSSSTTTTTSSTTTTTFSQTPSSSPCVAGNYSYQATNGPLYPLSDTTDYPSGNLQAATVVSSVMACANLCTSTGSSCAGFVWVKSGQTQQYCYLKSLANTQSSQPFPNTIVATSGLKSSGQSCVSTVAPTCPSADGSFYRDTNGVSYKVSCGSEYQTTGDLGVLSGATTLAQCIALCDQTTSCIGVTLRYGGTQTSPVCRGKSAMSGQITSSSLGYSADSAFLASGTLYKRSTKQETVNITATYTSLNLYSKTGGLPFFLTANTDGNIYFGMQSLQDPDAKLTTNFVALADKISADSLGRYLVYFPDEMSAWNVSRVRAVPWGQIPKTSRSLYIFSSSLASTHAGTTVAPADSLGNVFGFAACNYHGSESYKMFLINQPGDEQNLLSTEVQNTITGGVVFSCTYLAFTAQNLAPIMSS